MKITFIVSTIASICSISLYADTVMSFSSAINFVSDPSNTYPSSIVAGAPLEFEISYNTDTALNIGSSFESRYVNGLDLNILMIAGTDTWNLTDSLSSDLIEIRSVGSEYFSLETGGNNPTLFPSFGGEFYFNFSISESFISTIAGASDLVDDSSLPESTDQLRINDAARYSGNFFNLTETGGFISDFTFTIDPNTFQITTPIPEPKSTALILTTSILIGIALLSRRSRHK